MKVKICGIRSLNDLNLAIDAGSDEVGFLVGLTHKSEDEITLEFAQMLSSMTPMRVEKVLVTHMCDPAAIVDLAQTIKVNALQLQGPIAHDCAAQIRTLLPGLRLIKAIHVLPTSTVTEVIAAANVYREVVDAILLDSRTEDRLGGTGVPHDWHLSAEVCKRLDKPVVLAGGLTAENVGAAIELVSPTGVDVNSGVDDKNGDKDYLKCQEFVRVAHGAVGLN